MAKERLRKKREREAKKSSEKIARKVRIKQKKSSIKATKVYFN